MDHDELMRRLSRDLEDSYDEALKMEIEDRGHQAHHSTAQPARVPRRQIMTRHIPGSTPR